MFTDNVKNERREIIFGSKAGEILSQKVKTGVYDGSKEAFNSCLFHFPPTV